MSHYTVKYEKGPSIARTAKALEDIVDYLGWEKFVELTFAARAEAETFAGIEGYPKFANAISFAGVKGFPVVAWHDFIFETEPFKDAVEQ